MYQHFFVDKLKRKMKLSVRYLIKMMSLKTSRRELKKKMEKKKKVMMNEAIPL